MIRTLLYDDETGRHFKDTNEMFNCYLQGFGQNSVEKELVFRNGNDSTTWLTYTNTTGKVKPYKLETPVEDWNKIRSCFLSYTDDFDNTLYNKIFSSFYDAVKFLTEEWLEDFWGEIRFITDDRTDNGKSFFIKIRNYNGETFPFKNIYFVVN